MSENKTKQSPEKVEENTDQYDTLLRALEEKTVITVNDSTPNSTTLGEFTVEFSNNTTTKVSLYDGRDYYEIRRKGGNIIIGLATEEGLKRKKTVETIEVLGINGR
jgi:hypothetical protein